jgi:hypothetical protein
MDYAHSVNMVAIEHLGVPKGTPMHENAPLNHSSDFTQACLPPYFLIFSGWYQHLNLCVKEITWVLSRFLQAVVLQSHLWQ